MEILRFLGRGSGHEKDGQNCQDRLSCKVIQDERVILAIADGCSSSSFSEETAQCNIDVINEIFTKYSIDSLTRKNLEKLFPRIKRKKGNGTDEITACFDKIFKLKIAELYSKIKKQNGGKNNIEYKDGDFCATLLFVISEKEKTLIGHIGDGNIICFDKEGKVVYRSEEDNGEDSTHTYFTISKKFNEHFRYDIIPSSDIDSVIMFSDGPQRIFKHEKGDIVTGAYDLLVKPVADGIIRTDQDILPAMRKYIAKAKYYVFDDWSIIIAHNGDKIYPVLEPVSLDQVFKEEFSKIVFDEYGNIIEPIETSLETNEISSEPVEIPLETNESMSELKKNLLDPKEICPKSKKDSFIKNTDTHQKSNNDTAKSEVLKRSKATIISEGVVKFGKEVVKNLINGKGDK